MEFNKNDSSMTIFKYNNIKWKREMPINKGFREDRGEICVTKRPFGVTKWLTVGTIRPMCVTRAISRHRRQTTITARGKNV